MATEKIADFDAILKKAKAAGQSDAAKTRLGNRKAATATFCSKATIRVVKGEIARVVDEAETALIAVANAAPIMERGGMLVQPIVGQLPATRGRRTEATMLRRLSAANVVYLLNKHAAGFERYDARSKNFVQIDPPPAVATQLLEKGKWQFPRVAGVISAPTLRPDGTILDRPGYDQATQLWYAPDSRLVIPKLIDNPSRGQALEALQLLEALLVNFPFGNDVDHAVTVASVLTSVLRGAFDMAPMFLFRAHDVGAGKSYLADLISTIARGRPCPVITFVKSIEEMEKRLGALVLEGVPIISLDNCSSDIGGDLLCQITERPLVKIRILGKSETPECEWRGVLHITGNNVTFAADVSRRGLVANLDPKVERAELREFDFDPIELVLANRGAYVAAAITIARAYIAAGKPSVCGPLGSYEQWSDIVRAPLIWLKREDPVKSMDKAREEDPVRQAVNNLINVWRAQLMHGPGYTAAMLIERATDRTQDRLPTTDLYELLLQQAGTPRGDINTKTLSHWLKSILGRIHDGYTIKRVKEDDKHGNRYALVKTSS
jgi:putative DNA primase/helicase